MLSLAGFDFPVKYNRYSAKLTFEVTSLASFSFVIVLGLRFELFATSAFKRALVLASSILDKSETYPTFALMNCSLKSHLCIM